MKPKARRELQRVGSILEKALRKMSLDRKLKEHEIWNVWNDVVGQHVSRHAQPEFTKRRILFVRVSSSPWMQQLHYMGRGIVEALNERLGLPVIEEIRFKLGEIDPQESHVPSPPQSPPPIPCPARGTQKLVRRALSPIEDGEIREILGRVMLKDLGRRKGKAR